MFDYKKDILQFCFRYAKKINDGDLTFYHIEALYKTKFNKLLTNKEVLDISETFKWMLDNDLIDSKNWDNCLINHNKIKNQLRVIKLQEVLDTLPF